MAVSLPVGFRLFYPCVRKVSRTACGQYPEWFSGRFAACLSAHWTGRYSSFFFSVYPHVLLDAPQPAACGGVPPKRREKLLFAHCEPLPIRNRQRVEQGIEMRRAVHGGFLVVGTAGSGSGRSRRSSRRDRARRCRPPFRSYGRRCSGSCRSPWARRWLPVGHLSRQFRQRPHRAPANGASYWSDGRVSTNSPSRT